MADPQQQEVGKWHRDGSTCYILKEGTGWRRVEGKLQPEKVNEAYFRVSASSDEKYPEDEKKAEALAEKIIRALNKQIEDSFDDVGD